MADPKERQLDKPVSNMNSDELRRAFFSQMNTLGDSKAKLVKTKAYNLLLGTQTPISGKYVNDTERILNEVKEEFSRRSIPLPAYKPLLVRFAEKKAIDEKERVRRMVLSAGVRARSAAASPVAAGGAGEPRPVLSIPESPPVAAGGAGGGAGGAPWGGNSAESSSPGLPILGSKPPMHPPGLPYNAPPKANSGCVVAGGRRKTHRKKRNRKSRKM